MNNKNLGLASFAAIALLALSPIAASAACLSGELPINDQSERLDERVQNLAHQTGCPLETNDDFSKVEATAVPALSGSMTALDAYSASLKSAGLSVSQVNDENGTHFKVVAVAAAAAAPAKSGYAWAVIAAILALLGAGAALKILSPKKKGGPVQAKP